MMNIPYRAVAFDLDDSMLRSDLTISGFSLDVLRRIAALGVHVIPASGRARLSMKKFVDQIGCASLYISCNGAEIWSVPDDLLIHEELIPAELGREVAGFGNRYHCYTHTYEGPYFLYNMEAVWVQQYAAATFLQGRYVGDLETYIREPRSKILMMDHPDRIGIMLSDAREQFEGRLSVTCSKPHMLEFSPLYATKGIALSHAADYLGLDASEIIAFGDSLNDLSMLRSCGKGVLVANGRTELRPLCDDVCGSNDDDGIARYLSALFGEKVSE